MTVSQTYALICNLWKLPISVELNSEETTTTSSRSYLHYLSDRPDLVAAKCWATFWLLESLGLDKEKKRNVIEYFAGAGISTTIIRGMFDVDYHVLVDKDGNCFDQLSSIDPTLNVIKADFTKIEKVEDHFDLKFLDFPRSSIANMHTAWGIDNFLSVFKSGPSAVVWTDTAVSYSMAVHGKTYKKYFNTSREINSPEAYYEEYSSWLFEKTGYSIASVAKRANNALYMASVPGLVDPKKINFRKFDLNVYSTGGFVLHGPEIRTVV